MHSFLPVLALVFNAFVWGVSWWPFRQLHGAGLHPLWATALMYALAVGGLLLVRHLRRRSAEPASAEGLSPAELQRAQRLLDEAGGHP